MLEHKLGAQVGVKDATKAAAADGSCGEQQQQRQQHKAAAAPARVHKIRRRSIVLKYAQTSRGGNGLTMTILGDPLYVCVCEGTAAKVKQLTRQADELHARTLQ